MSEDKISTARPEWAPAYFTPGAVLFAPTDGGRTRYPVEVSDISEEGFTYTLGTGCTGRCTREDLACQGWTLERLARTYIPADDISSRRYRWERANPPARRAFG